ncbi:unnamed protein product, partial [Didymodactylos carnosus]
PPLRDQAMNFEILQRRLDYCANATVDFDEIFNENLCSILNNIRHNSALEPMMLTTTLLPSVAHLCQHAFIRSWSGKTQPFIIYAIITALPCSGKSVALKYMSDALVDIEKWKQIKPEDSHLNCSASIESLLAELKKHKSIIQIFDEMNTFVSSMGLYINEKAAYDRAYFCMLFNGESYVRRQTCGGSTELQNTRLNIVCCGQPLTTINSISEDISTLVTQDGLFARFIVCAPLSRAPYSSDFKPIDINVPTLSHLFYAIDRLHADQSRVYEYSQEACAIIKSTFDECSTLINTYSCASTFMNSL